MDSIIELRTRKASGPFAVSVALILTAGKICFNVCLFVLLIYLQAGTRQEPHWVINAKSTYCRSLQTLV